MEERLAARHPTEAAFLAGDALRGVAAMQVFLFHATFGAARADGRDARLIGDTGVRFDGAYGFADHLFAAAPLAVYVYFSLSGYLLSRRFISSFVEGRPRPSIRRFLQNRALRILPAFWLVIAISLLLYGTGDSSLWEVLALPLNLQVYVHGPVTGIISHAWTINTEWVFYIGLPLGAVALAAVAGTRLDRRGRLVLLLVALAAVYVVSLAFRAFGPVDTYYQRGFWAVSWAFVPGVALAVAELLWAERMRGARRGRALALALLGLSAAATAAFLAADPAAGGRRAVLATISILLLIGAPLVLQWTTGTSWRALDNRPLRWLGERSYSFYLLQLIVGVEVSTRLSQEGSARADLLFTLPIAFGLTLVLSYLGYRFVESPFLVRKVPQSPAAGAPLPEGVAGDERVAAR